MSPTKSANRRILSRSESDSRVRHYVPRHDESHETVNDLRRRKTEVATTLLSQNSNNQLSIDMTDPAQLESRHDAILTIATVLFTTFVVPIAVLGPPDRRGSGLELRD